MIEPELIYIDEPNLTFGFNQKTTDPRDGLMLFGPYSHNQINGQINVGIIGPDNLRSKFISYLKTIHKPVKSRKRDVARPDFPGIEAVFSIYLNFDNIPEIKVSLSEINKFLHFTDNYQRVHNLTNLYSNALKKYLFEEEMPVNVWFVVIPEEVFMYGRPESRIPKSIENINIGLKKSNRDIRQLTLFVEESKLKEAYLFEVNFHNQLKAKLLDDKIVTQIVRESKFDYENYFIDQKRIEKERIFDSAKAWNISTTLYYKIGGLPWRLGDVRDGVCYLGLVYKKLDKDEKNQNACCAAQMFLDSGDGMVFRGNIGPWYNPKTGEFHISQSDAYSLISKSLNAFRDTNPKKDYPKEVFIHAKTYFEEDEWKGFLDAAKGKSNIVGIRIRNDQTFKLYRDFSYSIPRGAVFIINDNKAYLWSKGYIPRLQTQLGLETPNPLSIEISRGISNIKVVCQDMLALTKLNYNTCLFGDGLPVTLKFADSIGEVLTAGKNIEAGVLPFKHYI